ncbi:MAG: exosome complex protein Rrp42 [Candidatus Nanoarchaeia archaeon]|nr:exosome complex protein Rrp42 [Candidatus Nanoarchaeia archaeon]
MKLPNINKKRILTLLRDGKRLDGRKPFELRDISIETGVSINAEGTSRVKIGKTEVVVGVKMDVQEPYPDHENEGTMITSMEFSPAAGERWEGGPPGMDSIEIARVVDRGIRESGFIDWKKLCIKEGEKVWSVLIDIYCINDDGNAMDASALGAIAALKLARFPVYDEKEEKVKFGEFTDKPLPLTEKLPLTLTFHKIGDKLIIDPNRDEEDSGEARITIAVSSVKKEKMINAMQKGGITPFTIEEMEKIIEETEKAYDKIFAEIEKKIKHVTK